MGNTDDITVKQAVEYILAQPDGESQAWLHMAWANANVGDSALDDIQSLGTESGRKDVDWVVGCAGIAMYMPRCKNSRRGRQRVLLIELTVSTSTCFECCGAGEGRYTLVLRRAVTILGTLGDGAPCPLVAVTREPTPSHDVHKRPAIRPFFVLLYRSGRRLLHLTSLTESPAKADTAHALPKRRHPCVRRGASPIIST